MSLEQILSANHEAVDRMIATAEEAREYWTTPRAPGKWSPDQVVEHVARTFEAASRQAAGQESGLPTIPSFVRPIVRGLFFNRVLKKNAFFMKAKTNPAMNPATHPPTGPENPEAARERLQAAVDMFADACRKLAANGRPYPSGAFGDVPVEDYARFMEIHTHHHRNQIQPPTSS
jgi:hypothetical protein